MRNDIDSNYIFGEIKMWNDGNRKNEVGFLVEAQSDLKFFSRFFPQCIPFTCEGWENVLSTIQKVNQAAIEGILGIIDADFKHILNKVPTDKNIFLTDYHDKEIMMINSRAWFQVLHQHADTSHTIHSQSKLQSFEANNGISIKTTILQLAKSIGII